MNIPTERVYETLTDLLSYLQFNYPDSKFNGRAIDFETGQISEQLIPSYLFRGEPGFYDQSLTSLQRMKSDSSLSATDITILEAISIYVNERVQKDLKVNKLYSEAYIQHYGLYSSLLDFTADLDVCSRFASSQDYINKPGRICVLDVKKANKASIILDLGLHPFASRARLQKAYGVCNRQYSDFKDIGCIEEMGLIWFEFKRNNINERIATLDIYKSNDDKFSGHLCLMIDDCIKENGRITKRAAEILSERVARTPLFGVTSDLHKIKFDKLNQGLTAKESGISECDFYLASANELGCRVDMQQQKLNSYRKWSIENKEPQLDIKYEINAPVFAIQISNFSMLSGVNFE